MAMVNVRVDCSPLGLGLPVSLAGMEGMMDVPLGFQLRLASSHQGLLAVGDAPLRWVGRSSCASALSSSSAPLPRSGAGPESSGLPAEGPSGCSADDLVFY